MSYFKTYQIKKNLFFLVTLIFIVGLQSESLAQTDLGPNLALKKPSKQSSDSHKGRANMANDGNTDGVFGNRSVSHTEDQYNAWWQVDLGQEYDIYEIRIWNRVDCCTDRLSNFDIWVTKNSMGSGENIDPFVSEPGNLGTSNRKFYKVGNQIEQTNAIINTKRGRYIRVQLNQKNNLHLAEVQVYGKKDINGELNVYDNINPSVMYSYTVFHNGSDVQLTKTNNAVSHVSAGYNFSKKTNVGHKTYGELAVKSRVETNEILAKASLEIDAKFGAERTSGNSSDNSTNFARSTDISKSLSYLVPAHRDIYIFNKFVLKEVGIDYKEDGKTYSWVKVLDKAPSKDNYDMEFENGTIIQALQGNNDQWITEKVFNDIYTKYLNDELGNTNENEDNFEELEEED